MTAQPSILRIDQLRLTLAPGRFPDGPREVLRGVSLEIPRGTCVALLGTTGSGKSLLCRSITRFFHGLPVREVRGAAWFEGLNLLEAAPGRLAQVRGTHIGHLLQSAHEHFHPRLTIAQHFELVLRQKRPGLCPRGEHVTRHLYLAGIVDPDELLRGRVFPFELDAATRQRIMIALVLSCEPALLVADEPTADFDSPSAARLAEGLESLKRERGLSILLATGRLPRAAQFGDRVAVLDQGVIAECGPPGDLFRGAKQAITRAFVDGTPVPGKPRERLLGHRKPAGEA